MDFTPFLQRGTARLHLPYIKGNKVCDRNKTYRIRDAKALSPAWYAFEYSGRYLEAVEQIETEIESHSVRAITGYVSDRQLLWDDGQDRLWMLPAENEPELFASISATRWFDGSLLFRSMEFEGDAEIAVRQAFEDDTSLAEIKGIRPALAQAFLLESTRRELAREAEQRRAEEADRQVRQAEMERWQRSLEGRIALALSHTGAELRGWRRTDSSQVTVRYTIGGRRFECVIDAETLQIIDSGICLEGADRELNLSSLPSAVQEAANTGQLHVFRRG